MDFNYLKIKCKALDGTSLSEKEINYIEYKLQLTNDEAYERLHCLVEAEELSLDLLETESQQTQMLHLFESYPQEMDEIMQLHSVMLECRVIYQNNQVQGGDNE